MPRTWAFMIAGWLMGFGTLFMTVWSNPIPDARSLAAMLFAFAAIILGTARAPGRGKTACRDTPQASGDVD